MHAHKFLAVFMLFLAISAASISALIGEADEAEDFEFAEIEMVKNCYLEGFEGCEYLIGPIFKIELLVDDIGDLVFPPDTEAYELNQYPKSWVRCQDPEAVVLARYDEVNKKWVPIEGSLAEYDDENGGVTVSAEVGEDGYYSVIPKLADFGFSFEEEEQSSFCEFLKCGEYTAYVSNPFNGRLHSGEELAMTFCGIYPGCKPIADGECSTACPPGNDPNCPLKICPPMNEEGEYEEDVGRCCGPGNDECCDTTRGNGCDPNCWTKVNEDGVVIDSTDLDCVVGGDMDLLASAEIIETGFEFSVNSKRAKMFPEPQLMVKSEYQPEELESMVNLEELKEEGWDIIGYYFENPIVLAGPVKFEVEGGDGAWFKEFTLTNINDEELLLFPLKQGSGGTCKSLDWRKDLPDNTTDHTRLRSHNDPCAGGEDDPNYQDAWSYFIEHPDTWFLTEDDTDYDNYEGGLPIFDLTPITVKRMHFKATNDDKPQKVKVTFSHFDIPDSDVDKDGWGVEEDCHDSNPLINPGMDELCDGIDNNCNPKVIIKNKDAVLPFEGEPYLDWDERWVPYHFIAPCYGYILIEDYSEPSYAELWKREDKGIIFPVGFPDTIDPYRQEKYYGDLEGFYGDSEIVELYSSIIVSPEDTIQLETGGPRKLYPWVEFQHVFAKSNNYGQADCWNHDYKDGPPSGCSSDNQDDNTCILGSYDSCGLSLFPTSCEGHQFVISCGGDMCSDLKVWNRYGDEINEEDKIEFKPGELIYGPILWHHSSIYKDHGNLELSVYCYTDVEFEEILGETIDEGCTEQAMRYLYVCDGSLFDGEKRDCVNSNMLWKGSALKDETISKNYIIPEDAESGEHKFYVFACTEETEEENCWQFYEDIYFVCSEEENCDANLNIDANCDGIRPYKPIDEQASLFTSLTEAAPGDITHPLDPDCVGKCPKGECDLLTKKVCVDQDWVEPEDYCHLCSHKDSGCMEESKECAEEEKSCDNGCRVGVCDVSANMICISGGKWSESNYQERCATKDSEFPEVECEQDSCDTQFDKTCRKEIRGSAAEWIEYEDFCTNELSCHALDSDCEACTPGTCDTYADKFCTASGTWKSQGYCDECGAVDAGCGIKACLEGACDYNAGAVCESGNWKMLNFNDEYCEKCKDAPYYEEKCGCDPIETKCDDGVDNDCDGVIDCDDSDCERKNVCLPTYCTEEQDGEIMDCGTSDVGWCVLGTRTCVDKWWTDCEGSIEPETESCNNIDDDCDGAKDEECTGCTIGETKGCGQEAGSCSGGIQECKAFGSQGKWSGCFGPSYITVSEEVCNGLDDDCDGSIDEGCPCNEDETQECGDDTGECQKGIQTCINGEWAKCEGEIESVTEVCDDGLDNDCDGLTDILDDACSNTEATSGLSASCYDQEQNQGEEAIDCGGDFCMPCDQTTCDDRKLNAYEEDMDCGGPDCPPCYGAVTTTDEPEPATTKKPAAKKKEKKSNFMLYLFIFIAILLALFFITTIVKMKKTGKPFKETVKGMFTKRPKEENKQFTLGAKKVSPTKTPTFKPARAIKPKVTKTREEMALEESMKKSKEMLKKR